MDELLNKVYNEDCLCTMRRMSNNSIDLVITSPPYDNLRSYDGYSFCFEDVATALHRVVKPGGVVVWVVGDQTKDGSETGTSFRQALFFKEIGFNLHDTMIYSSPKPPLTHRRYEQEFEYMFVFSKGRPKTFNPIMVECTNAGKPSGGTIRQTGHELLPKHGSGVVSKVKIKGNIWRYATGIHKTTSDKIAFQHPAVFPEQLASDHISSWSSIGDTIYDPFAGSGTTGIMSAINRRNFVMSEVSEKYCGIIKDRFKIRLAMDVEVVEMYKITNQSYQQGQFALRLGKDKLSCPYLPDSEKINYEYWVQG